VTSLEGGVRVLGCEFFGFQEIACHKVCCFFPQSACYLCFVFSGWCGRIFDSPISNNPTKGLLLKKLLFFSENVLFQKPKLIEKAMYGCGVFSMFDVFVLTGNVTNTALVFHGLIFHGLIFHGLIFHGLIFHVFFVC